MAPSSVTEYADELFGGEDEYLARIRAEAEAQDIPMIQVPTELARLLTALIAATGARKVLEIGTLFGYSTLVLARALPADGTVVSLEIEHKHRDLAQRNLEGAGLAHKVDLRLGPGQE